MRVQRVNDFYFVPYETSLDFWNSFNNQVFQKTKSFSSYREIFPQCLIKKLFQDPSECSIFLTFGKLPLLLLLPPLDLDLCSDRLPLMDCPLQIGLSISECLCLHQLVYTWGYSLELLPLFRPFFLTIVPIGLK